MTFATVPLPAGESSLPRVFGARPFHTDGDLLALAFAPDGALWSVEEPGMLRRWNAATRQQVAFHALDELATLWSFGPAARCLAAGSDELSVWDVASGRLRASWPQPSWVTAVAFPPSGGLIATGHDDSAVRVWELAGERLMQELRGHEQAVSALAFSPDGTRLASAGEDKVIRVWEVGSGKLLGSLPGHTDRVPALAWSPDGSRLYSAGWDTTARVWDLDTWEPVILLNSHAGQVTALALSPDGTRLACADSANAIHLWDTQRHRTIGLLRGHAAEVRCLAFSPDGQRLAYGGVERVIRLWDAQTGGDPADEADPLSSRTGLAVSPDGTRLASLGAGTGLRVWSTSSAEPALELEGNPVLRAFAASADGRWLAGSVAAEGGVELPADARDTLRLWQAGSGRRQAVPEGQLGPITALAFAPDTTLLASAGYQSSDAWLWHVPSGEPYVLLNGAAENCSVEALAFHPRGRLLAVAGIDHLATSGQDGFVAVWDVRDRKQVVTLPGGATALAFSGDGRRLAVVSLGQKVLLYDVDGWQLAAEAVGHLDAINALAYAPYGGLLATGSDDRTVRLWDAETGLPRGARELDTQVKALAFAPDGRHLFTGNANTSCYRLDVAEVLDREV
jgi:WD40 repeat protein